MDNVTKWRVISCLLDLSKDLQGGEIRHQDNIYKIFTEYLGWPENSIDREMKIRQGSTPKRVDFVLKKDNSCVVPIEVKTAYSAESGVEQLGSYMLHLGVDLGILIRDKIYFFYDDNCGRNMKMLDDAVFIVPFSDICTDGDDVVRLLDFSNFNPETIKSVLIDLKNKKQEETRQQKFKDSIVNKIKSVEFIHKAIKAKLNREGPEASEYVGMIDEILDNFEISVKPLHSLNIDNKDDELPYPKAESPGQRHKFKFKGQVYDGCSDLAYAIVKEYVNETNCTINELRKELKSAKVTSSIFKLENDVKDPNRSWPERMRLDVPGDRSKIRIYTMWNYCKGGNDNFSPLLRFAAKQGWEIEEL